MDRFRQRRMDSTGMRHIDRAPYQGHYTAPTGTQQRLRTSQSTDQIQGTKPQPAASGAPGPAAWGSGHEGLITPNAPTVVNTAGGFEQLTTQLVVGEQELVRVCLVEDPYPAVGHLFPGP